MASLRLPVPSARLIRFLRQQTESLSFFSSNHDASLSNGKATRRPQCASLYRPVPLQAGVLNFQSLVPARNLRTLGSKRLPYASISLRRQHNPPDRQPTPCKPAWQEWLWGFGTRRPGRPLEPDDLPEVDRDGNTNSMFNTRRQLSQKAASEPRLRCTEVDENGNVILVDSEFKKSELIARVYQNMVLHTCQWHS
jgi:magnesium transporter